MTTARPTLGPDSLLARFADKSKVKNGRVHWRAFLPSKIDMETSTFDVSGMSNGEVWALGDAEVAASTGVAIEGRAELTVREACVEPLFVVSVEPPPRHAAIRGWKDWDTALALAKELGARATSRVRV